MLHVSNGGERFDLLNPTTMPRATGFLWNRQMMIQVNCRGYVSAQFMQPEPAKYVYGPTVEAKTFMLPEQPYYNHHPGRFVYIKDEETAEIFSVPYEPVRARPAHFRFSVGTHDIAWRVEHLGLRVEWSVSLPVDDVAELWQLSVVNASGRTRRLSVYPYIPLGYMSWMNQSARYRADLGGVVASYVTPYQKLPDYFKNQHLKDKTFFLHDREPMAWEANRDAFEGEGGLHAPTAVLAARLAGGDALYESPVAALQYRSELPAEQTEHFRFLLGPAFDDQEIAAKRDVYFADDHFARTRADYGAYIGEGRGVLRIETPDEHFNQFVNHWLPRQVYYHGDVNRLTTDPQTRNFLQDQMGMSYIKPAVARQSFLFALSQQEASGAMPDGILLRPEAELKYINQVPHTDHSVWLPVCLRAYLDETNDYDIFSVQVKDWNGERTASVFERVDAGMHWLLQARDQRGLSYIAQGDWCDPMNMVGHKGRGVSGWLSVATAYALRLWAEICEQLDRPGHAETFRAGAEEINRAVNEHLWDGSWYGRGITDDGVVFGISKDEEGRIFLNPQSWAILAQTADAGQREAMIRAIEQQLETPYGVMMLAPAYTAMRDDVGRITQKHPGAAENGSIYNHAAAFYAYSLYTVKDADRAYRLMRQMVAGPDTQDYLQRGQMPVFIPNCYRGAFFQFPRTAGRSSQLANTGTVSWVYRSIVDGLFGLRGDARGLRIEPQLPSDWQEARVTREFRGGVFEVTFTRHRGTSATQVYVDGQLQECAHVGGIESGRAYRVEVTLPQR